MAAPAEAVSVHPLAQIKKPQRQHGATLHHRLIESPGHRNVFFLSLLIFYGGFGLLVPIKGVDITLYKLF